MIRLSANVSKKVPMPDVEYSSRSFSAGIEVEVSADTSEEGITDRLEALYGLLEASIDRQIGEADAGDGGRAADRVSENGRGRCRPVKARRRRATEAQVNAIYAIARDRCITDPELDELIVSRYGADGARDLAIAEASELIDDLKAREPVEAGGLTGPTGARVCGAPVPPCPARTRIESGTGLSLFR